ncbi:uncharacterized protein B4U79_07204 [Dinothrombium tinctorium]|uniref:G-protein coupled receptors family 1 profile domain-containing protein n=1 Tax=Dinothrombium tinctorium TaxID=1965070 RepID=A0A3S3P6Z9_9ACAR|nr:uncharacterized protein B4U79_07204 [Dinothrombium tinctorium]
MVLVVVFAFTTSWTPYFLVTIITQYQEENYFSKGNYFFTMLCINLFAFLNSSVNPFIYVIMSTRFRNGFNRIFRCILCASRVPDDKLLPSRGPKTLACLSKYHRQMVLFACGEPTQISTDSVQPSESAANSGCGSSKAMLMHSLRKKSTRVMSNNSSSAKIPHSLVLMNPMCSLLPVSKSLYHLMSTELGSITRLNSKLANGLQRKAKSESMLHELSDKDVCEEQLLRKFELKKRSVTICNSTVEVYSPQVNDQRDSLLSQQR